MDIFCPAVWYRLLRLPGLARAGPGAAGTYSPYGSIGARLRSDRRRLRPGAGARDPRIAAALAAALGGADRVLNVGVGTGSYEPGDRPVVAVDPSQVMLAQRPADSVPCIQAAAEALPFGDGTLSRDTWSAISI